MTAPTSLSRGLWPQLRRTAPVQALTTLKGGLAGGFLIRSENRFLLGTLAVLTLLLYRVTGIGPAFSGWIVARRPWA